MTSNLKKFLILVCTLMISCAVVAEPIWIDVRTAEEFTTDHIKGDANVPLASIKADELATKYGKDAELMLYCKSGNRAGQAKALLEAAGFTKVTNAGGITDVRKLRQLAESSASPAK